MSVAQQIADHAHSLFDAVGISRMPSGDNVLILRLESTVERNLDEFGGAYGVFQLYGFEKHAGPKLESVINFIRGKGFFAELVGQYGYPRKGELNLKEEAIRTGLGKRGKSSVVLHHQYGPRLRFMALKTNAPLESLVG